MVKTRKGGEVVAVLPELVAFLTRPANRKRAGRLTFVNTAGRVTISPASDPRKGHWIAADGVLLAQLLPSGEVVKRAEIPPAVLCLLDELEADPSGAAAEYGRTSGVCCYCGKELTDGRSKSVGYGATCAKSYRLPWG